MHTFLSHSPTADYICRVLHVKSSASSHPSVYYDYAQSKAQFIVHTPLIHEGVGHQLPQIPALLCSSPLTLEATKHRFSRQPE